jgi:Tfp pilus assembly protein PilF
MPSSMLGSRSLLFVGLMTGLVAHAFADEITCGALANPFGPYDYRTTTQLQMVEPFHFTREVEMLKSGNTGSVGGDIDYTLRAFPNHYRALVAMMNLQFLTRAEHPPGTKWPVPCYFDRAIRFAPDDATVRTIFGVYLMHLGRTRDAVEQFELAARMGDDSANLHYNLGLAYFEVKDYDKSLTHAQRAYALGFSLPGLKQKLKQAGKWPSGE